MSERPDVSVANWGDRYAVLEEIGRGGMSTVYRAQDLRVGSEVAIKVLRREIATTTTGKRFAREIRIASRLEHPNILPVIDSGDFAGLPFLVMPLIKGESLQQCLRRDRQLPVLEAVRVASNVAEALSYAHRMGVVHRDVKPSNIMLAEHQVLVTDFGIARDMVGLMSDQLTESGETIGTAYYMSPEQGAALPVDRRCDIYSLGCVLYEMLAGNPPFVGSSAQEILQQHLVNPVPSLRDRRAEVVPNLERAVLRALSKLPEDRYVEAREFRIAIEQISPTRRWFRHS